MSHNNPELPDFETLLQDAMGIRLTQVAHTAIKFTISSDFPNARKVRRTTVVSVIEKTGKLSNLVTKGAK